MKKSFLLGALAFIGVMNAQVDLGVKAGYTLSGVEYKDNKDTKMRSSFYLGGFAEYKLGSNLSFQGGLTYSPLGFKTKEERGLYYTKTEVPKDSKDAPVTNDRYKIEKENTVIFHTLMVPLSVKYKLVDKISVQGGANIEWAYSSVIKRTEQFDSKNRVLEKQKEYINEEVNKFGVTPFIGLTYDVNKQLFVEGRYNYGVMSVLKNLDVYNRYLQVGVGYKF